jgi:hypothetical protein
MGFSRLIVRINSRISWGTRGLPGLPHRIFQVQRRRKPLRCQPITVAALTMKYRTAIPSRPTTARPTAVDPLVSASGASQIVAEHRVGGGAQVSQPVAPFGSGMTPGELQPAPKLLAHTRTDERMTILNLSVTSEFTRTTYDFSSSLQVQSRL